MMGNKNDVKKKRRDQINNRTTNNSKQQTSLDSFFVSEEDVTKIRKRRKTRATPLHSSSLSSSCNATNISRRFTTDHQKSILLLSLVNNNLLPKTVPSISKKKGKKETRTAVAVAIEETATIPKHNNTLNDSVDGAQVHHSSDDHQYDNNYNKASSTNTDTNNTNTNTIDNKKEQTIDRNGIRHNNNNENNKIRKKINEDVDWTVIREDAIEKQLPNSSIQNVKSNDQNNNEHGNGNGNGNGNENENEKQQNKADRVRDNDVSFQALVMNNKTTTAVPPQILNNESHNGNKLDSNRVATTIPFSSEIQSIHSDAKTNKKEQGKEITTINSSMSNNADVSDGNDNITNNSSNTNKCKNNKNDDQLSLLPPPIKKETEEILRKEMMHDAAVVTSVTKSIDNNEEEKEEEEDTLPTEMMQNNTDNTYSTKNDNAANNNSSNNNNNSSSNNNNNNNNNNSIIKNNNEKKKHKFTQMYIDFGQQNFAKQTICKVCGMLYVHGVEEDKQQHEKICSYYREGVPFQFQLLQHQQKHTKKQKGEGGFEIVARFRNNHHHNSIDHTTTADNANNQHGDESYIIEIRVSSWSDTMKKNGNKKKGGTYVLRQKIKQIREVVDLELGFSTSNEEKKTNKKYIYYLYIRNKRIVGMIIGENIQYAYQLILTQPQIFDRDSKMNHHNQPHDSEANANNNNNSNNNNTIKAKKNQKKEQQQDRRDHNNDSKKRIKQQLLYDRSNVKQYDVKIGIHLIWVHFKYRKQNIASTLLNSLRSNIIYGTLLEPKFLAFSSPTIAGIQFAYNYLKNYYHQQGNGSGRNKHTEYATGTGNEDNNINILVYDCYQKKE